MRINKKKARIVSAMKRKHEEVNREDIDYDQNEIYQNQDENDLAHEGLEYIPEDDSDDDGPMLKSGNNRNKPKFVRKSTDLNEDGDQVLKLMKKKNQMKEYDSGSAQYDSSIDDDDEGEDESEEDEVSQRQSSAKKRDQKPQKNRFVEESDVVANNFVNDDFNAYDNSYLEPKIIKHYSSDLFEDPSPASQRKRFREDEDDRFGDISHKRPKFDE